MLALLVSASIGYGIANQTRTDPVPHLEGGAEVRALFGGEHGDQWSVWLGSQPERRTKEGVAYRLHVSTMPAHGYVAGLRRFNKRLGDDEAITLFAGTGLGYRDLETCLDDGMVETGTGRHCFGGDAFVTSRWAFAQELGFRWKVVEISLAHFSTGGISTSNIGVNYWRFTLFGKVGRDR